MTDDDLRRARDLANRAERAARSALMADDEDWRARRAAEARELLTEALEVLD